MTSQVNGTKNGCIMKNFNKIFFAAVVAAFGLVSCSQELTPVEKPQGNLVTVNFGAEASIACPTKATLTTEDEKLFTSAWENGDALSVKYSFDYGASKETTATWSADKSCFEAQMEGGNGIWIYDALYPTPKEVSFGSERTQNGSNYNDKYDLMYGTATAEGADAGKTADGKNIVFEMTRQTAVAYFHLTGTLDEDVVSAKLSVEGDGAYISTSDVKANEDYAKGYAFTETEGVASKEINLTFDEGTAPKASDFKLWFNVLPTIYTKMTLTVETANHTMTISRTAADMYEAGKLYKVVKEIPTDKWVSKAAYNGGDLVFDFKTVQPKGWPTSKDNATAGTYKYVVNGVDYSFIHGTGIYCAGTTPTSAYLMIANSSSLGLPAIMGYRLVKVVGTLNDTGSPSTKAQISITNGTDVVSGGTAQTWNTKGADYTYTLTDTEENTIYYLSVSSTAKCQMIKLVLSYEPATPSVPKCATPEITVDNAGVVSITCETAGATIHYTVGENPADPTEADAVFSAVTLTDGQTIKAIAVAEGFKPSAVALKKYVVGGSALVDKTATIKFGANNVEITKEKNPVTANDDQKNSWTITTAGTDVYFATQNDCAQVGSSNNPATSITFTSTLPEDAEVTSISAKFGGYKGTAGDITLKVGETSVGTGKLNAKNDVTVTSTSTAVGNKVTITVTNIAKGVKCYNIQVKYKTAN